jgi:hypothetical protein
MSEHSKKKKQKAAFYRDMAKRTDRNMRNGRRVYEQMQETAEGALAAYTQTRGRYPGHADRGDHRYSIHTGANDAKIEISICQQNKTPTPG